LLGRHIGQGLNRGDACRTELLDQALAQTKPHSPGGSPSVKPARHLLLHFWRFSSSLLDVNLPAQQFRRQPDVLALLADGQR